jgi:O-antigen/teichoic acid export membrane protein
LYKLRHIPASFYLLSGRLLIGLGQLLMIKVLTSILESAEMGKYYLLMSVISGVSLFSINPVIQYIQRQLHGWNQKGLARLALKKLLIFLIVVGMVTSFVVWGLKSFSLTDFGLSLKFLFIAVPLLITVIVLTGMLPGLCNILGKYRAFVLFSNIDLWGKIGSVYLFALLFPHVLRTILWSIVFWGVISALMSGLYLYCQLNKSQDDHNPFDLNMVKRELFPFAWPLGIAAGLYWAQSEGYRFILQNTAGIGIVGKFVVAFNLGAALMIAVDTLFHQLYLPIFYKEISAETDTSHLHAWNKYAEKLTGVCIPIGVYIACAGPFLARWFVNETYWNVGIFAAFGAISQLFRTMSACFYYGIVARKTTNLLILPYIFGTAAALAGTFILSPRFPLIGTGISLILSYVIVCIGSYLQLKRELSIQIPWLRIGEAILFSMPLGCLLLAAFKFGWDLIPLKNLLILLLTGLGLLFIQWKMSKDVWLQQERVLSSIGTTSSL